MQSGTNAGVLAGVTPTTYWNPTAQVWETSARGRAVLADPRINKGTAFPPAERDALGRVGLIPPRVLTLDEQATRVYEQCRGQASDLDKNIYLTALHDRNEVLFYRVLTDHLTELLPIVYTPTIGDAIKNYSHAYRRPRGVYLNVDHPQEIDRVLRAPGLGADDVDLVVATDAQAILGIGDWGVGGIDIAVGKLAVYTAAAGIDPARVLAVMLDVGTDRAELLDDPLYLGSRHPRVGQQTYDDFIARYVRSAQQIFPRALLHWEDFGAGNAHRILDRYRGTALTFNDDVQGTGAVNLAAILAGAAASGTDITAHRVAVYGSGTAGIGVADQLRDAMVAAGLTREQAQARFWCLGRTGLLTTETDRLRDFQVPYARAGHEVADWNGYGTAAGIGLAEVVRRAHPTVLIGTSGQAGAFTKEIVAELAAHVARPIILPLSNPTVLAEARPDDLLTWTDGRALIATGSPFEPVDYDGTRYTIGQANNALVFPGLGLGAILARAQRITDNMIVAAATAVGGFADASVLGASLLPRIQDLRSVSAAVALAVATAAVDDGVAQTPAAEITTATVQAAMWQPAYRPLRAV